jgi:hypothetical protein
MENTMPLNKFAAWGAELVLRPRPPGLGAVTRLGLAAIERTLDDNLPGKGGGVPPPVVKTPSSTALRIVWSLNAVRDALSDQGDPNVGDTNEQIEARHDSDAVIEIAQFIEDQHADLLDHYHGQFRMLDADPDDLDAFDLERRERLAELATFELLVVASVEDPAPTPAPPALNLKPAPAALKSRSPRRATKRR